MSKLWGGRFTKNTHQLVEKFGRSIQFDYKLAKFDCLGSLVHINILKDAKLLSSLEHSKLKKGLQKILKSIDADTFKVDHSFEDIHSYVQHLLEKDSSVGKAALKLHTCRSRNDQVVFDTKCYCLANITQTRSVLESLNKSLTALAKKYAHVIIPGYTHLQHAIPVSLSHHLLAYVEMLKRDQERLKNAFDGVELSFGSGSLAGTFIPASKYRQNTQPLLGKNVTPPINTMDAVSDRDFVIEILSALSIIGMHLSRLSEDVILWASAEFDFIDIDDAFCTGSSLMPQKKNPDVLELVRGYSGRLYGNLMNVFVLMKGLPLTYNRDMQHDKEPLFDSFEIVQSELEILAELFKNVTFKENTIKKQLDDESLYATDIADYLVQNKVPFKDAHGIIGRLIQEKYQTSTDICQMSAAVLKKIHPLLTPKVVKKIIDPKVSVSSKKSVKARKLY